MEKSTISAPKLYKILLTIKLHEEIRRDEINKYYTSLFTALVAIMPIIEKFIGGKKARVEDDSTSLKLLVLALSFTGIIVSISWVLSLKRIYNYIAALDSLIIKLEEKLKQPIISYIKEKLHKKGAPDQVAKQTMLLPYAFFTIFVIIVLYNLEFFDKGGEWLKAISSGIVRLLKSLGL